MAKKTKHKKREEKQDWLVTAYGKQDKVVNSVVIKNKTEQEAEKEAFSFEVPKGAKDWTMVKMSEELERFCEEHGQTDEEAADALGFDAKDDGFSELMIGHDYVWCKQENKWVQENSRNYDKRDDVVIEYIKINS